jgi:signal transduction histidine kinase
LTIEKTAEGISIAVKDNGYGIPEDVKSKIFTKLFRADNIREKEPSGTGLGLYLLKSLVDKLGGKVWFESKEGLGSIFYVTLASVWENKKALP